MREIKFRAWNVEESDMYYDAQNTYDYMHGEPESIPAMYFGELLESDQWRVMQYTGLHDMSGRKIYEEDILQCDFSFYDKDNNRSQEISIGTVEFRDGEFYVEFGYNTIHGHNISTGFKIEWLRDGARSEWRDFEIIGNIYENPGLIK